MTDRELMQMALRFFDWFYSDDHSIGREDFRATQKALRDRLAQPERVHAIDISQERVDETAKHRHEWVGLTEDEAIELLPVGDWEIESTLDFAKAIEAKLKEKNT